MTELEELAALINSSRTDEVERILFERVEDKSHPAIELRAKFAGVVGQYQALKHGCGSNYCELEDETNDNTG